MNNNVLSGVPFVRIGVFFDGSFFTHVSDHYLYHHPRHSRLSIDGLHDFIREQLAEAERVPIERCRVVEAHYFRGRMSARDAADRDRLLAERQWDETLLRLGVTPYYLPLATNGADRFEEKGVDVWYALEAYERARDGRFDVAVLIACDGDYVPLVRKLQRIGVRVMVLGCHLDTGRTTRTSRRLLSESTYPILLNDIIDDPQRADDPRVLRLFIMRRDNVAAAPAPPQLGATVEPDAVVTPVAASDAIKSAAANDAVSSPPRAPYAEDDDRADDADNDAVGFDAPLDDEPAPGSLLVQRRMHGVIGKLKEGFGFARVEGLPRDVFFHHSAVTDRGFLQLREGEAATFLVTENERGFVATQVLPSSPPPPFDGARSGGHRPTPTRPAAAIAPVTSAFSDDQGYPL